MKTTMVAAMMVVATGCGGSILGGGSAVPPAATGSMAIAMTAPFSILATTDDQPNAAEPAVTATAARFDDRTLDVEFDQSQVFALHVTASYAADNVGFGPGLTVQYRDLRADGGATTCQHWTGYGIAWVKAPPGAWQLQFSGTCSDYTAEDANFPVELSISGTADELYLATR